MLFERKSPCLSRFEVLFEREFPCVSRIGVLSTVCSWCINKGDSIKSIRLPFIITFDLFLLRCNGISVVFFTENKWNSVLVILNCFFKGRNWSSDFMILICSSWENKWCSTSAILSRFSRENKWTKVLVILNFFFQREQVKNRNQQPRKLLSNHFQAESTNLCRWVLNLRHTAAILDLLSWIPIFWLHNLNQRQGIPSSHHSQADSSN